MKDILTKLETELKSKNIYDLRQVGRATGVSVPTNKKHGELVNEIMAIAQGIVDPCPPSKVGAPPKSRSVDQHLVEFVNKCRELSLEGKLNDISANLPIDGLFTEDGDIKELTYTGVVEYTDKYWFVRVNNMQICPDDDLFIHEDFISKYDLRKGDKVVCRAKRRRENECPGVTYFYTVNGKVPTSARKTAFDNLTPCYPDKRITLETENSNLTERVIDLFAPIGFGQRALIAAPPRTGKTTMLTNIAHSIHKNHPNALLIMLLIDERPEDVTDVQRSVEGAEIIYSTFDKGDNNHVHVASLTLEYAKRQVEDGRDVVILLDSITRLTRAYNAITNSGRMLDNGLDLQALVEPKRFFGAARNIEGGGSLTIVATASVKTGSRLDDSIYEEFRSASNMEITVSREMAALRIYPAIEILSSSTRKEELLLSPEEIAASTAVRSMLEGHNLTEEKLFFSMNKYKTNAGFCADIQSFIKVNNG